MSNGMPRKWSSSHTTFIGDARSILDRIGRLDEVGATKTGGHIKQVKRSVAPKVWLELREGCVGMEYRADGAIQPFIIFPHSPKRRRRDEVTYSVDQLLAAIYGLVAKLGIAYDCGQAEEDDGVVSTVPLFQMLLEETPKSDQPPASYAVQFLRAAAEDEVAVSRSQWGKLLSALGETRRLEERVTDLQNQLRRQEGVESLWQEEIESLKAQLKEAEQQLKQAREREVKLRAEQEQQLEASRLAAERFKHESQRVTRELTELEERVRSSDSMLRSRDAELKRVSAQLEALQQRPTAPSGLVQVESYFTYLQGQLALFGREIGEVQGNLHSIELRLANCNEQAIDLTTSQHELEVCQTELLSRGRTIRSLDDLTTLANEAQVLKQQLAEVSAQLATAQADAVGCQAQRDLQRETLTTLQVRESGIRRIQQRYQKMADLVTPMVLEGQFDAALEQMLTALSATEEIADVSLSNEPVVTPEVLTCQWPQELLDLAKGQPLCLLMNQKGFDSLVESSQATKKRRENYRRFAEAGADLRWLLELFYPGSQLDVSAYWPAFQAVLEQGGVTLPVVAPYKKMADDFASGLGQYPFFDKEGRFDPDATTLIQELVEDRLKRFQEREAVD